MAASVPAQMGCTLGVPASGRRRACIATSRRSPRLCQGFSPPPSRRARGPRSRSVRLPGSARERTEDLAAAGALRAPAVPECRRPLPLEGQRLKEARAEPSPTPGSATSGECRILSRRETDRPVPDPQPAALKYHWYWRYEAGSLLLLE